MSLWTRTPMFKLRRGPLLVQTLAVCYAARAFNKFEFITDSRGAELAERLGWRFNRVMTNFDSIETEGLEHIWALGKLLACLAQDEPFVQLDGDVLLFKDLPERFKRARLIAQSPDVLSHYTGPNMMEAFRIAGIPSTSDKFNAGLLGGSDPALVRAWAMYALELAKKFKGCSINGTTTSMVVEQASLGLFAERVGVNVATLFERYPTRARMEEVGYTHLHGHAKHMSYWLERVEKRLRSEFPEAYRQFLKGCEGLNLAHPSDIPYSSYA